MFCYLEGQCEYVAGTWSACHSEILMRKRRDPLQSGSANCPPVNVIEKVCGFEGEKRVKCLRTKSLCRVCGVSGPQPVLYMY